MANEARTTANFGEGTSPKVALRVRDRSVTLQGDPLKGDAELNPPAQGTNPRTEMSMAEPNVIAQIFHHTCARSPWCFRCWRDVRRWVLLFLTRVTCKKYPISHAVLAIRIFRSMKRVCLESGSEDLVLKFVLCEVAMVHVVLKSTMAHKKGGS